MTRQEVIMKVRRVNRYYCDFCKKSGCSKGHLRRHEEHCTLNPNRVCGVCAMLEETQSPLEALVAMLPSPKGQEAWNEEFDYHYFAEAFTTQCNKALKGLRNAANDCPACILAAIRLSGIPVAVMSDFDWAKEMKNIFDEIRDFERGE